LIKAKSKLALNTESPSEWSGFLIYTIMKIKIDDFAIIFVKS